MPRIPVTVALMGLLALTSTSCVTCRCDCPPTSQDSKPLPPQDKGPGVVQANQPSGAKR